MKEMGFDPTTSNHQAINPNHHATIHYCDVVTDI